MVYVIIQENATESSSILALLISIYHSDKEAESVVYATDTTINCIESFVKCAKIPIKVTTKQISNELSIESYACHFIKSFETANTHDELIYLHPDLLLVRPIHIPAEVKAQGIGFIEKALSVSDQYPYMKYSCDIMYISSKKALTTITKLYIDNTILTEKVIKNIKLNKPYYINSKKDEDLTPEGREQFATVWKNLPIDSYSRLKVSDEKMHYIPGMPYLATENFFAVKDSWDMGKVKFDTLEYMGHQISALNIRFKTQHKPAIDASKYILSNIIKHKKAYLPIFNMKYGNGKQDIIMPEEKGICHWDRTKDRRMYDLIDSITFSSQFLKNTTIKASDYFAFNNYVLFDKPCSKWLNNSITNSYAICLFDYSEELLTDLRIAGHPCIFFAYCSPYPDTLDSFDLKNHPRYIANNNDLQHDAEVYSFPDQFVTAEEYSSHLAKLSTYKYAGFTTETEKYHFAECLKLGVIPIVSEHFEVLKLDVNSNYVVDKIIDDDELEYNIIKNNRILYNSTYTLIAIHNRLLNLCYEY